MFEKNCKINLGKDILDSIIPVTESIESVFKVKDTFRNNLSLRFICNPEHLDNILLNEDDKLKIRNLLINQLTDSTKI